MKIVKAFILSALLASTANAQTTIATGGKTGSYYAVGLNIASVIGGIEVANTKGSLENLDLLRHGEVELAIVQADSLAWYVTKHPEMATTVEVLSPVYEECVFIAVNRDGVVTDEDDLQSEGVTIGIGKKGAGGNATWDYMRQLEPGYKKAAIAYTGGSRALGKLAASAKSSINAVLWVTKPRLEGKNLQTVLKNAKTLRVVDVNDKDLNDKFPMTGEPIYYFKTIEVEKGFLNDQEIKTICMQALLIARSDADEEMLDGVADLMLNYKETALKGVSQ